MLGARVQVLNHFDLVLCAGFRFHRCGSPDLAKRAGSISKGDLKRFLAWAAEHLGYSELAGIGRATPTAELEPLREGQAPQTDEQVLFPQMVVIWRCQSACDKTRLK